MMDLSHGPYVNVKCPHCGWGWATYDGEKDDEEDPEIRYAVTIVGGQYTKEAAVCLTKILNGNSLQSRQLLKEGGTIVIGNFPSKKRALEQCGIRFKASVCKKIIEETMSD